jgi:hypothetical protein
MPSEKPSQALPSELEVPSADREDCHSQDDSKVERPKSLPREALFITIICSSQLLTQAGLALSIVPHTSSDAPLTSTTSLEK